MDQWIAESSAVILTSPHFSREMVAEAVARSSKSVRIIYTPPIEGVQTLMQVLSVLYFEASRLSFAQKKPLLDITVIIPALAGAKALAKAAAASQIVFGEGPFEAQDGLKAFLSISTKHFVDGERISLSNPSVKDMETVGLYPNTVIGGTFDHLHAGHKILLTVSAALASRRLIVGVTGSVFLSYSFLSFVLAF